ncbi:hypothetical protein C8R42DRAFT_664256 [Lentinula raphanica]|nr:hypothetical protein C8R42DRAFT_664256 [Lentinula raphanica]
MTISSPKTLSFYIAIFTLLLRFRTHAPSQDFSHITVSVSRFRMNLNTVMIYMTMLLSSEHPHAVKILTSMAVSKLVESVSFRKMYMCDILWHGTREVMKKTGQIVMEWARGRVPRHKSLDLHRLRAGIKFCLT